MAVVRNKSGKPGSRKTPGGGNGKAAGTARRRKQAGSESASGKGKQPANASSSGKGKAGKRSARNIMERYKDARPSDVSNKVFVASSPVHGKGLFAARRIKANTVLGRLHGMPTYDDGIYVLWITDELGLELTNDFKYINHDKNPNAVYSDIDVMVLRDVEAGEELLHDYGW
jgi:hypothetical protein